ncbi:hypothetical protein O181_023312 [Austropuccinia psidii MF-1]|uniref:TOG domain-containing protein n=1 Tax=Austropuccinia psidii MF-1 TaxID=1389203 RepID=A0A9Q3GXX3_9BASI|nr:hypothetical protein [Austropuccinia psidii MF-1]
MLDSIISNLQTAFNDSDNEKKINGLNLLRKELESNQSFSSSHLQTLVNLLKSSLESSNGHLSFAALSALPSLANTLNSPDQQLALKQLITSLCSSTTGSIVSLLAESKQRTRDAARAALLAMASAACQSHLKSNSNMKSDETLQELERIIKEHALTNKSCRTRVQAVYYLSDIRSKYPSLIPVKTYLPILVSLLEDSDASVRSATSDSIITIFSDPSLPSSARADLKNELSKQSVRKSSVDLILAKVFSPQNFSHTSSLSTANQTSVSTNPTIPHLISPIDLSASISSAHPGSEPPPSMGVIHPIFVSGARELESIFAKMLPAWEGKETEHNWQAREANLCTIRGMIKTNAHTQYPSEFILGLKSVSEGLLKSLGSLRTTLAVAACNVFVEAGSLGIVLDPLLDIFLPTLLHMAAQTKKMVFQASGNAVTTLIKVTSYHTRVLQFLLVCVNEKTTQARAAGISHLQEFIKVHGQRSRSQIESGGGIGFIESCLKRSLADASPQVRETARQVFWSSAEIWPQMTSALIETLDGPTRKQLEKASSGRRIPSSSLKLDKPTSSRVSVRSMIKSTRTANRARENSIGSLSSNAFRVISNGTTISSVSIAPSTGSAPVIHSSDPQRSDPNQLPSGGTAQLSRTSSLRDTPPFNRSKNLLSSPPLKPFKNLNSQKHIQAHRSPSSQNTMHVRSISAGKSPNRLSVGLPNHRQGMSHLHSFQSASHKLYQSARKVSSEENLVEDAMKAQAEQAESAAHRLLELTEDENWSQPLVPLGPGGVLLTKTTSINGSHHLESDFKHKDAFWRKLESAEPLANKDYLHKQFDGLPGMSYTTLTEELSSKGFGSHTSKDSWWHRQAELSIGSARLARSNKEIQELVEQVEKLDEPQDRQIFIDLAQACAERPYPSNLLNTRPSIVPQGDMKVQNLEFWNENNLLERLFDALKDNLLKTGIPDEVKGAQLVLLRGLILHESGLIAGKETELWELLLRVAATGVPNLIIAVEALGSLWAETSDPVYGLSCLRSCVEVVSQDNKNQEASSLANDSSRSENWMGLAMNCLGRFFSRLPIEIVEEELPKASELIKKALNHQEAKIRMSAVMSLVLANTVIKNDKLLFGVLGDLTNSQEALLTYYLTSTS